VRVILETLRPNAQPIGPYDVLLAGHALALGATLVTHNTREFARVPGLTVEDWQSA
jgi:tRNA(fMet)-specific endonuclease VapC